MSEENKKMETDMVEPTDVKQDETVELSQEAMMRMEKEQSGVDTDLWTDQIPVIKNMYDFEKEDIYLNIRADHVRENLKFYDLGTKLMDESKTHDVEEIKQTLITDLSEYVKITQCLFTSLMKNSAISEKEQEKMNRKNAPKKAGLEVKRKLTLAEVKKMREENKDITNEEIDKKVKELDFSKEMKEAEDKEAERVKTLMPLEEFDKIEPFITAATRLDIGVHNWKDSMKTDFASLSDVDLKDDKVFMKELSAALRIIFLPDDVPTVIGTLLRVVYLLEMRGWVTFDELFKRNLENHK